MFLYIYVTKADNNEREATMNLQECMEMIDMHGKTQYSETETLVLPKQCINELLHIRR